MIAGAWPMEKSRLANWESNEHNCMRKKASCSNYLHICSWHMLRKNKVVYFAWGQYPRGS